MAAPFQTANGVSVAALRMERHQLTRAQVPELWDLYRMEQLPLRPTKIELELQGVPTAVANALRRAVLDEMEGRALQVPEGGFNVAETTERFMLPQFVNKRISLLPLGLQISPETVATLRLRLDSINETATLKTVYAGDLAVTAGHMPTPLFNPTFPLCTLEPGNRIVIDGIRITAGYGRASSIYNVACQGVSLPLDIGRLDRKETHEAGGSAVDESGFTVSCLVANPRHHLLRAVFPATSANYASEVRATLADACSAVLGRLRLVAAAASRSGAEDGELGRGIMYTVVRLEDGLTEGQLLLPGETDTIGGLLKRAVFDGTPGISFVEYAVASHENVLKLTIRHTGDVTQALLAGAGWCIAAFEAIRRGILASRAA